MLLFFFSPNLSPTPNLPPKKDRKQASLSDRTFLINTIRFSLAYPLLLAVPLVPI